MNPGFWGILLVGVLVVLLFGRGKISSIMGDVAKGITAFKKGIKEGQDDDTARKLDDEKVIDVSADKTKERYES